MAIKQKQLNLAAYRSAAVTEKDIKRAVTQYLDGQQAAGRLVYLRLNSGAFFTSYKGRERMITMCPPGTADLCVINRGRIIFLELKRPDRAARQQPNQLAFQRVVEAQGAGYYVVRSLDELRVILDRFIIVK